MHRTKLGFRILIPKRFTLASTITPNGRQPSGLISAYSVTVPNVNNIARQQLQAITQVKLGQNVKMSYVCET